jgi:hypothetical protein
MVGLRSAVKESAIEYFVNSDFTPRPEVPLAGTFIEGFNPCPDTGEESMYISVMLRESAPYLRDAGWRETAQLLIAAAQEIEELKSQLDRKPGLKVVGRQQSH